MNLFKSIDGMYPITYVSKDDMKGCVPNLAKKIDALTEDDMSYIAGKMGDDYVEQLYWESMKIIVTEFLKRKEEDLEEEESEDA